MEKNTLVLGLGNPLMADEGIGAYLVQRLAQLKDEFPNVDFIDAGTGGMAILHLIQNRPKVIIIDCARMGLQSGDIKRFTPEQAQSVKALAHHSLHEADILGIIDMARRLGRCAGEIVIFGIEPEIVQPAQQLSSVLADRIDYYIVEICVELTLNRLGAF